MLSGHPCSEHVTIPGQSQHSAVSQLYVVRRRGRLTPRQPLSVCALLPAPRKEQASTASWKPRPPFEAAEMD